MEGMLRGIPDFQRRSNLGRQRVLQTIPLPGKQLRKAGILNSNIFCSELIVTIDIVVVVDECLNDREVVAC